MNIFVTEVILRQAKRQKDTDYRQGVAIKMDHSLTNWADTRDSVEFNEKVELLQLDQ